MFTVRTTSSKGRSLSKKTMVVNRVVTPMRTKISALSALQILLLFAMAENSMAICPDRYVSVGTQCYSFPKEEQITWTQAFFLCKFTLNGSLVEIDNQDEQDNLRKYIETVVDPLGIYAFWIGASDQLVENEFRLMTSGNLLTFKAWYFIEPNSLLGDEDCIGMFKLFNYMWDDVVCANTRNFVLSPFRAICEVAPTQ